MDWKTILFDDEEAALSFLERHWERVFNVGFCKHPEAGDQQGWHVKFLHKSSREMQFFKKEDL